MTLPALCHYPFPMRTMLTALLLLVCFAAWAKPCSTCQQDSPAESLFCQTCVCRFDSGRTCPDCAQPSPETARFCAGCGHKFGFNPADEQRVVNEALKARGEYLDRLATLAAFYKEAVVRDKLKVVEAEVERVKGQGEVPALKATTVEAYAGALVRWVGAGRGRPLRAGRGLRKDSTPSGARPTSEGPRRFTRRSSSNTPERQQDGAPTTGQIFASSYVGNLARPPRLLKCALWNPKTDRTRASAG